MAVALTHTHMRTRTRRKHKWDDYFNLFLFFFSVCLPQEGEGGILASINNVTASTAVYGRTSTEPITNKKEVVTDYSLVVVVGGGGGDDLDDDDDDDDDDDYDDD